MTNKEALKAQFQFPLPDSSFELALLNAEIDADVNYTIANKKDVELALAGLILIVTTAPKSVSELDYSLTTHDISELVKLRSLILKRYNVVDEAAYTGPVIQDASHLWGASEDYC